MKNPSDIILAELGDIRQVVHAACVVESAIRGEDLNPHDVRVQTRAAEIILMGVGAQVRAVTEMSDREREKSCSA